MSLPAELLNMVFVEELKATPPEIEKMLVNGERVIASFKSLQEDEQVNFRYLGKFLIKRNKPRRYSSPYSQQIGLSLIHI